MLSKKGDLDKQNNFNKANELAHKKKDETVHSYKLLKDENYKMKLVNWKKMRCGNEFLMVKNYHQNSIQRRASN